MFILPVLFVVFYSCCLVVFLITYRNIIHIATHLFEFPNTKEEAIVLGPDTENLLTAKVPIRQHTRLDLVAILLQPLVLS